MQKVFLLFTCLFTLSVQLFSQNEENIQTKYNPHNLFSPLFYPSGGTISRAATGGPNVGYWQNKADYQITTSLNDVTNEITG